jgi:transcriptional regulator with XRE-family HTH domain
MGDFSTRLRDAMGDLQAPTLADRAGVTKQTIYNILDGVTKAEKVRAVTLFDLAKALDVTPQWLLHGKGDRRPVVSQPARIDGTKLAESIAALRQVAKRRGWNYDPETHPLETEYAYALRCALPDTPSTADVIDFGERLADRLRQRAEGTDGQSDGGAAGGVDRRRAQGKRGAASEA